VTEGTSDTIRSAHRAPLAVSINIAAARKIAASAFRIVRRTPRSYLIYRFALSAIDAGLDLIALCMDEWLA
jgi:hypothetical protein